MVTMNPAVESDCAPGCDAPDARAMSALRERLPRPEVIADAADLFRLLADPTRLALLQALADAGELCVCDLAAAIGVSDNTVSQSMRLLRTADVVRTRREGRRIHYRLADAHVRMLLDVTVDHVSHAGDDG